jgi:putative thioredoxin
MQPLFSSAATAPAATGPGAAAGRARDITAATFMQDVIEASREAAIVVDFWAPWCGPCKTLGPLLEKLVAETKGAVRMVKINVDEPANQGLAGQLRIQSIPTVYAFLDGRPVDMFQGALPESQLRQWLKRLVDAVGPADASLAEVLEQAKAALTAGDVQTAAQMFDAVLQAEPANSEALTGMARCLLTVGQLDEAKEVFARIPAEDHKKPDVVALKTAIELAEQTAAAAGASAEFLQRLAANPDDHEARFELAMALYGAGDKKAAVDHLLEIVSRNRSWNEEAARKQLVKFFEAFGFKDPLAVEGRKRLSTLLFK